MRMMMPKGQSILFISYLSSHVNTTNHFLFILMLRLVGFPSHQTPMMLNCNLLKLRGPILAFHAGMHSFHVSAKGKPNKQTCVIRNRKIG
ncbi:hypothetical protein EDB80DRAFT_376710 [Ilyonectria destructans]|nr:hypothetical protein EDB80DRAFT_376710 [Ilyonectria destructans]